MQPTDLGDLSTITADAWRRACSSAVVDHLCAAAWVDLLHTLSATPADRQHGVIDDACGESND